MVIIMKKATKFIISLLIIIILFVTSLTLILPYPILNKSNYIEIYDINNNLIYSEVYKNESQYTPLKSLNTYTYQSFVAIEDKNFYNHGGFDILRNIKAFFINLFSLSIKQGASTITQQYARNTLLTNKRNLSRKIKEAFYTIQIEREYTKDQILEGYLNSLYFGHGLNGIHNASKYYFNKFPSDLTLAESAILAAICNAPSLYSPKTNETGLKKRQELVLYQMLIQDYINPNEYQDAIKEKINYTFTEQESTNFNYYKDAVITELNNLNLYTKENLNKGLKIYTTNDINITNSINDLLQKYIPSNQNNQTSIVILQPFTNNILYMTGGFNYDSSNFNRAIYSARQIGSTIKPLLYSLALENGFTPNTLLTSEPTTFNIEGIGEYSPKNPNDKYAYDKIDMIQAIALSDNIYALKTLLLLGSENLVRLLNNFDIESLESLPSIALGTTSTSLLKLTTIYNTFASLGEYYKPYFISKVTDMKDNTIYSSKKQHLTLLDKNNTLILNQMLTSTFDSSLSSYLSATLANYKTNNTWAAKSGTTNSDSYVLGFNPNYTIGIWSGTDDNSTFYNSTLSKQLFKEIANILGSSTNSWYNITHKLKYKNYNPNTHTFDNISKTYLFKKDT